jgi:hypothetical protein
LSIDHTFPFGFDENAYAGLIYRECGRHQSENRYSAAASISAMS